MAWALLPNHVPPNGFFLPVEGVPDPVTLAGLFRHRLLRMLLEEGVVGISWRGPIRGSARR